MTAVISSARLDLVPLAPALLQLIEDDDLDRLGRRLGVEVPGDWAEAVPARRRLSQLTADPDAQPWLIRAIVSREPRFLVGSIGFHEVPDDLGCVEIGYQVVAARRRCGYAREAALALADWAFESGKVDIVMAAISPGNEPSIRLAESLGFVCTDHEYDVHGAPELIFESELPLKR
jgi:[ribosomal protein S5]-alanine N-acetyltransferase